jgi:hypothetical protein
MWLLYGAGRFMSTRRLCVVCGWEYFSNIKIVNFWFRIPVIRKAYIYVSKDVKIRGYFAQLKGTVHYGLSKCWNGLASQKNWILSMRFSLPRPMGGAQHNGLCPPRSLVYSTFDFYLWGHQRDILAPNMATHGTNNVCVWSGWNSAARAWNFSACR